MSAVFITTILTGLVIPFYLLVLITLVKFRHKLDSSFFKLFFSTGCADLCYSLYKIHYYLFLFYTDVPTPATLARALGIHFYFAQVLGMTLMTMNRASAITKPLTYEETWSKKRIVASTLVQWTFPLLFSLPHVLPSCRLVSLNGLFVYDYEQCHQLILGSQLMLETFVFAPLVIVLYVYMLIRTITHNRHMQGHNYKQEKRMAFTALCIAIPYIVLSLTTITWLLDLGLRAYILHVFVVFSVLFTSFNPFALIGFCGEARKCFLGFVCCKAVD